MWRCFVNAPTNPTDAKTTSKGQITLNKDLLRHLGIPPGGQLELLKLPNGEIRMRAKRPKGDISAFFGMFKREGQRPVSIEEMNEAIAKGWAGLL
jgi:bifunctional DNA-binding transcriptional regulator/antitoxin component of YhaV-PrlF toxin-antitoxin module